MSFTELLICGLVALFVLKREDFDKIINTIRSFMIQYKDGKDAVTKAVLEKNSSDLAKDVDNYISKIKSQMHDQ